MKQCEPFAYNFEAYERELSEYQTLLSDKTELKEREDILPFFTSRPHLASQIATIHSSIVSTEKIAYEFDVFGDFKCDLAVGEPETHSYCFIEFEDATKDSLFVSRGKKYKSEFSPRLEHGFSQVVDWFYKLENLQNTLDMNERFGSYQIHYEGLLIIGRDQFVSDAEMKRLKWRVNNTVINSKHIYCYTYDQLYYFFDKRLSYLKFLSSQ